MSSMTLPHVFRALLVVVALLLAILEIARVTAAPHHAVLAPPLPVPVIAVR